MTTAFSSNCVPCQTTRQRRLIMETTCAQTIECGLRSRRSARAVISDYQWVRTPGRQEWMDAVLVIPLPCACFKRCAASFESHHIQRAQPPLLPDTPQTKMPVEVFPFLCFSQEKTLTSARIYFRYTAVFSQEPINEAYRMHATASLYVCLFVCWMLVSICLPTV